MEIESISLIWKINILPIKLYLLKIYNKYILKFNL